MPKSLENAAAEIRSALDPLPDGYYVKPEPEADAILVGTEELAFAISRLAIEDGVHIRHAKESFPALRAAVAQHHATIAADSDVAMLQSVARAHARAP